MHMHESSIQAAHDVRVVVGRMRRRLREVAGDDELTPSQTAALSRLLKDGPATTSDLAQAERVRQQSMAATVAVLLERRLVRRSPDPDDGRRQILALTDRAQRLIQGSRETKESWLSRQLEDRLTEAERQTVLAAMRLLEGLA